MLMRPGLFTALVKVRSPSDMIAVSLKAATVLFPVASVVHRPKVARELLA